MKSGVVCVGMCGIDVLIKGADFSTPFESEQKRADSVGFAIGGDAANEAVVLSSLGVPVKLVAGVGRDNTGDLIKTVLNGAGVDTEYFIYNDEHVSSINVVVIGPDGQRNFVSPPNTEAWNFVPPLDYLKGAKIVSLGSLMVQPFTNQENILRVVKAAKENGSIVCADVIAGENRCPLENIKEALPYIDYFFPNDYEAEILTGKKHVEDMADVLLEYGIKNVVIKVGKEGSYIKNLQEEIRMPAYTVKVLDTTGAGDNFAAGFMCALAEDKGLKECCRFATAVAAISVQHVGANGAIKSREQVEDFIRKMKLRKL
ncbi:MAG: carbohydrate kinase family protein [Clostridiales bacterium]|nr:carbohydrate kinase family protein [Clostridiales bacterium]